MDQDRLVGLYEQMLRVMLWEQKLLRLIDEGKVSGFYHAGRGQEAVPVGAIAALRQDDYLLYAHRGCGYMIAKGLPMNKLFGDFLANTEGTTRGLGAGIVHIAWPDLGILGQSGTLGGAFPIAAGAGLSAKYRGTDQVVMCFFGEATQNRGTFQPVVELQFADFVAIAMDEIYDKAAKWRYMHGGLFEVPLVIRAAEGAMGGAGPEHSQCPEALFWSAAGLYVLTPSTPADAKGLLKSAIRDDNPVLFLEHKALVNTTGSVPEGEHLVPIGQADIKREGTDATVIAWSNMVPKALAAAETLEGEDISVEVVDPRGIRPLDRETILASVEKTGRVVLAHEAPKPGGPGSEVAAIIAEEAVDLLEAPVKRIAAPDVPIPQSQYLEQFYVPTDEDVANAVRDLA